MLKQGDIVRAFLGKEKKGSSVQAGYRPCVIVNEILSEDHPVFMVSPITREKSTYPWVQEVMLSYRSYIHYEHVFTIPADHSLQVIYSLSTAELGELRIKINFCFGGAKTNILNLKKISFVMVLGEVISGNLVYEVGGSYKFKLPVSTYQELFGEVVHGRPLHENLSSLDGLRLIFTLGEIF